MTQETMMMTSNLNRRRSYSHERPWHDPDTKDKEKEKEKVEKEWLDLRKQFWYWQAWFWERASACIESCLSCWWIWCPFSRRLSNFPDSLSGGPSPSPACTLQCPSWFPGAEIGGAVCFRCLRCLFFDVLPISLYLAVWYGGGWFSAFIWWRILVVTVCLN